MPVQVSSHPHRVISPWLWGLLPDNEAVLRRWAREFHVSPSSAFSLLATPAGEDCAGAVRFAPPDRLERMLGRAGEVTWLSEDEVAQRLRELREDSTAWLGRSFTGQFSLAGAQAKTALFLEETCRADCWTLWPIVPDAALKSLPCSPRLADRRDRNMCGEALASPWHSIATLTA